MNVDEAMRRFRDPSEWKLRFDAPGYVAPPNPARAPLRFVAPVAISLVAAIVIAGVGTAVLVNSSPTPPAAPPVSPSPVSQVITPDDNRVAKKYASLATSDSLEHSAVSTGNDSTPWAVINANRDAPSLFIAYVAGGSNCGEHLGVEVLETATSVTIVAINSPISGDDASKCKDEPVIEGGMVMLDDSLGTRTLLHGALTAPWTSADRPIETVAGEARVDPVVPSTEMPPYSGKATCKNLLDDATWRAFNLKDWSLVGSRYTDKIVEDHNDDPWMYAFLDYGGIVCAVSDQSVSPAQYAYGPITRSQEEIQRKIWEKTDAVLTRDGEFDVYTVKADVPDGSAVVTVAFGDGQWAFVRDWYAEREIIRVLMQNMPEADRSPRR